MSNPKEKAEELFMKFRQIPPSSPYTGVDDGEAKQCALIAVNEILKVVPRYYNDEILTIHGSVPFQVESCSYEFYNKVKQELEKL